LYKDAHQTSHPEGVCGSTAVRTPFKMVAILFRRMNNCNI